MAVSMMPPAVAMVVSQVGMAPRDLWSFCHIKRLHSNNPPFSKEIENENSIDDLCPIGHLCIASAGRTVRPARPVRHEVVEGARLRLPPPRQGNQAVSDWH
jgi:hypothetical protein